MFYKEIKRNNKMRTENKIFMLFKKKDTIPIPNAVLCKLCCV